MKCINCGHEWDAPPAKVVRCPACGVEAEYLHDDGAYEGALEAERLGHFEEAAKLYARAAEADVPCAALGVWRCLSAEAGDGPTRLEAGSKIDFWLRTAADQGDPIASYSLALQLLRRGDRSEGMHYLLLSEAADHAPAARLLAQTAKREQNPPAQRYYLGRLARDSRAARWMLLLLGAKKEAEPLTAPARENVAEEALAMADRAEKYGLCHIAYRYLTLAGDHPEAKYRRALYDLDGRGERRDFASIRADLEQAAADGHPELWLRLGTLLSEDGVTLRDEAAALSYYEKAAEAGSEVAWMVLGEAYDKGTFGPKNVDRALHYYGKAAEAGYREAADHVKRIKEVVAEVLERADSEQAAGRAEKAFSLRKDMADRGLATACLQTAHAYLRGEGVGRSFAGAANYYRRAVEGGSAEAVFYLGVLCAQNCGMRFDYKTACALLQTAAENGFPQGREIVASMTARRRRALLDRIYSRACRLYHMDKIDEANDLLRAAARLGHARATYRLGCHLEYGEGMPPDRAAAIATYRAAAQAGYSGQNSCMKVGFLRQRNRLLMQKQLL